MNIKLIVGPIYISSIYSGKRDGVWEYTDWPRVGRGV